MLKWLLRGIGAILLLGLLFLAGGYWNATRTPRVVEVRLPLAGLPQGAEIRVLHMTDLHIGRPDMDAERLRRIVEQANGLGPDLIVLTGDYFGGKLFDRAGMRLDEALALLADLYAPLGVFAVSGNHDQAYWTPKVLGRQPRPALLTNSSLDIGPLVLVGLNSVTNGADYARAMAGIGKDRPILLIRHEGDHMAYVPRPPNPALVLAGHTHGGQVVLPLIGSIGDHWSGRPHCRRGLCQLGDWRVYVSSGIGTSVLPIRYGVPPELVLLTLYSEGRNPSTER